MRTAATSLVAVFLLLASMMAGAVPASAAVRTNQDSFIADVLAYTNQYRASNGLAPLM